MMIISTLHNPNWRRVLWDLMPWPIPPYPPPATGQDLLRCPGRCGRWIREGGEAETAQRVWNSVELHLSAVEDSSSGSGRFPQRMDVDSMPWPLRAVNTTQCRAVSLHQHVAVHARAWCCVVAPAPCMCLRPRCTSTSPCMCMCCCISTSPCMCMCYCISTSPCMCCCTSHQVHQRTLRRVHVTERTLSCPCSTTLSSGSARFPQRMDVDSTATIAMPWPLRAVDTTPSSWARGNLSDCPGYS